MTAANYGRRFDELCQQADAIEVSKKMETPEFGLAGYRIDSNVFLNWMVKVRHLLSSACGADSQHFLKLVESERPSMYTTNHEMFQKSRAVLRAAREDFEDGYLNTVRNLIQADVFESELEQAKELLVAGYDTAAAVVAGVVLETTLRQICEDGHIPIGKLDRMGADLAKAGVFNKLVQKQITAWADIRNSAAHGQTGNFSKEDVEAMIRDVGRFVAERLS